MFFHRKETMMPVDVKKPDPRFGQYLLEQFGGATGELTAALTYWVQSFHVADAGIRDMLQDIAIEEFSHLEMVGKLIEQHTSKLDQKDVYDAPLFRIRGMGPAFRGQPGACLDGGVYQRGRQRGARPARQHRVGGRRAADLRSADEDVEGRGHHQGAASPADARDHPRADVHGGAGEDGQAGRSVFRHGQAGRHGGRWCSTCRKARTSAGRGTASRSSAMSRIRSRRAACRPARSIPTTRRCRSWRQNSGRSGSPARAAQERRAAKSTESEWSSPPCS